MIRRAVVALVFALLCLVAPQRPDVAPTGPARLSGPSAERAERGVLPAGVERLGAAAERSRLPLPPKLRPLGGPAPVAFRPRSTATPSSVVAPLGPARPNALVPDLRSNIRRLRVTRALPRSEDPPSIAPADSVG